MYSTITIKKSAFSILTLVYLHSSKIPDSQPFTVPRNKEINPVFQDYGPVKTKKPLASVSQT